MSCLGVHISLDEEQSRALNAAAEDEVVELVSDLEERLVEDPERLAETDKSWDALHRALADGQLSYDGGTYPLNHAVLGGKVLYTKDDYIVSYKSAAQVKDIAAALATVDQQMLEELYWRIDAGSYDGELSEDDFEYTWGWFVGVKELYQSAAAAGYAVVFTADQ